MPQLTLSSAAAHTVVADVLVVAVAQGGDGPVVLGELSPDLRSLAESSAALLAMAGAAESVVRLASQGCSAAPLLVLTGVGALPAGHTLSGEGSDLHRGLEAWRRAAGAAVRSVADLSTADRPTGVPGTRVKVALALPTPDFGHVAAVAEGALLGGYTFTAYRSAASSAQKGVGSVVVLTAGARRADIRAAGRRAETVASAVAAVRDLVNTPPCDLYPSVFAEAARAAVTDLPVTVRVLDEKRLAKDGYGGLIGVGQGSMHPPRLVRLDYHPAGARHHVALVGKGITFDSGGLSIKPAAGMEAMKSDMAGAAAVLHTVVAAMPDWACRSRHRLARPGREPAFGDGDASFRRDHHPGRARPSRCSNTDAEGRLVLADALVAAGEQKPDLIVDVATLTGAQSSPWASRTSALDGQRRRAAQPGARGSATGSASSSGRCRCRRAARPASTPRSPTSPTWASGSAACWSPGCSWPSSSPDGLGPGPTSTSPGQVQRRFRRWLHRQGRHRRGRAHPARPRRGRRPERTLTARRRTAATAHHIGWM